MKRVFYNDWRFARHYEAYTRSSRSGSIVYEQERSILAELIPRGDGEPALDVAAGNGRLLSVLRQLGYVPTGADVALPMLRAGGEDTSDLVCADAGRLPFRRGYFSAALAHRFLFHYESIGGYFEEIRRVLKPGGWLCFDVLNWSPSTPLRRHKWKSGALVYIHRRERLLAAAAVAGFQLRAERQVFTLNPAWARLSPGWLARVIFRRDGFRLLPRVKTYFLLQVR